MKRRRSRLHQKSESSKQLVGHRTISPLGPPPRYSPGRVRSHRADRRRRNGAGLSGNGYDARPTGRDQDPARPLTTVQAKHFVGQLQRMPPVPPPGGEQNTNVIGWTRRSAFGRARSALRVRPAAGTRLR